MQKKLRRDVCSGSGVGATAESKNWPRNFVTRRGFYGALTAPRLADFSAVIDSNVFWNRLRNAEFWRADRLRGYEQ
jgi:hypothetical protein